GWRTPGALHGMAGSGTDRRLRWREPLLSRRRGHGRWTAIPWRGGVASGMATRSGASVVWSRSVSPQPNGLLPVRRGNIWRALSAVAGWAARGIAGRTERTARRSDRRSGRRDPAGGCRSDRTIRSTLTDRHSTSFVFQFSLPAT